jgi:hypothetical protein
VPQLLASFFRSVQTVPHRFVGEQTHAPELQISVGRHACPQAPQFARSVLVFVQNVLQSSGHGVPG